MTAPAGTAKAEASQPAAAIAPANGTPPTQGAQQAAADKTNAPKPAAAPIPAARPVEQPVNVVGTVTQRGNVVGQQSATAEKPAAQQAAATKPAAQPTATPAASNAPAGAYVIQIASLPSEAEAQKSYANLSAKFSSVIGGKSPDIKPAEIPGKGTYYRLRIVAGSKDEAIALCSRYKAAGGSCLVSAETSVRSVDYRRPNGRRFFLYGWIMTNTRALILGCSGPVLTEEEKAFYRDVQPGASSFLAETSKASTRSGG